jgi:radical SAM superfamily enzyme YgiQ (UPF0313 family)
MPINSWGGKFMKIVLVRPNYSSHIITPPLGLGYLASYLKQHNIEAVIIDGLRDNLSVDKLLKQILSEKPHAVGITCLTAFYNEVVELSRLVKKNNLLCIIGGVHPTFLPYQTLLDSKADYVICGEGEIALTKLIKNDFINNNILGVYSKDDFKNGNEPVKKAETIENLDDLPFPDWEQINPTSYPKAPHGAIVRNFPVGVITTTRGCPFECTFCASPRFYGRKIRFRTPHNVIQEIKYLIESFGIKEIHFEDDNLTLNRKHIKTICHLVIENNIKINWACPNGIRADCIDEELVILMKRSGCYYFAFGVESADPSILKNIKKHESIEVIKHSIEIADKCGIQCQGFFIFGLPGETTKSINETIHFAKMAPLARAQFLILDVLPGSELWDTLAGQFKPDWGKNSYKEPEWIPRELTKEQLMRAQSQAFRQFYLRPITLLRLAKSIRIGQVKFLMQRLKEYRVFR